MVFAIVGYRMKPSRKGQMFIVLIQKFIGMNKRILHQIINKDILPSKIIKQKPFDFCFIFT
jgi:hypothetical protein